MIEKFALGLVAAVAVGGSTAASAQVAATGFYVAANGDVDISGAPLPPYGTASNTSTSIPVAPLTAAINVAQTFSGTTVQANATTSATIQDAYRGFVTFAGAGSVTSTATTRGTFQIDNGFAYSFTSATPFNFTARYSFGADDQNAALSFGLVDDDAGSIGVFDSPSFRGGGILTTPTFKAGAYTFQFYLAPILADSRSTPGSTAGTESASVFYSLNPSSAVPEPATWGMMLLGFGLAGYAARRRAKVRTNVSFA